MLDFIAWKLVFLCYRSCISILAFSWQNPAHACSSSKTFSVCFLWIPGSRRHGKWQPVYCSTHETDQSASVLFLFEFATLAWSTWICHMRDCSNSFGLLVVVESNHMKQAGKDDDDKAFCVTLCVHRTRRCLQLKLRHLVWTLNLRPVGRWLLHEGIKLLIIPKKKRLICQHGYVRCNRHRHENSVWILEQLHVALLFLLKFGLCWFVVRRKHCSFSSDLSELVRMPPSPPVCALNNFENGDFSLANLYYSTSSCHPAYLSWHD